MIAQATIREINIRELRMEEERSFRGSYVTQSRDDISLV